ncbi:rod shape-determining protein MreD [bacterium]
MKEKIFFNVFLIFLVLFLEMVFLNHFHVNMAAPDFFLVLVLYFVWNKGIMKGQITAFFLGFLKDVFGLGIFGIHMMLYTIIAYLVGRIVNNIDKESVLHQIVIGFFSAVIYYLGFFSINKLIGFKLEVGYRILYFTKPFVIALFTPLLFKIFNKIGAKWFRLRIA